MNFKALMDGPDGRWTEERHSLFLNWMEATFVRRVLGVDIVGGCGAVPCRFTEMNGGQRLDRYDPVSSTESTADSRRRSPAPSAEAAADSGSRCGSIFTGRNSRKRPLGRRDASQDQVVPQFENTEDSEGASGPFKRKNGRGGS